MKLLLSAYSHNRGPDVGLFIIEMKVGCILDLTNFPTSVSYSVSRSGILYHNAKCILTL